MTATAGTQPGAARELRAPFEPGRDGARCHDFDLHGIVGIRLIDASPDAVAVVRAQLGPIEAPLAREPDVVVRFVDRLDLGSTTRLLGLNDVGFADGRFVVLRSKHKSLARVEIPFDTIGDRCSIVCERGLPAVPLLIPIINMTALAKGALPMHAGAFRYRDASVLVTGWSKGGKTETLLGFLARGAEYIGDEWIYLNDGGRRMGGIPEPIRVWDWLLADLPELHRRLDRGVRARLWALRTAGRALNRLAGTSSRRSAVRRTVHRLAHLLESQRHADLPPEQVVGHALGRLAGQVDRVIFVGNHDSPDVVVERVTAEEVADRMALSLEEERSRFMSYYRKFCFAFPERRNPFIEAAAGVERARIREFLRGRECFSVHHPYPPSIDALFAAIEPLVLGRGPAGGAP